MKITRVETLVVNMPMLIKGTAPMTAGRPRTSIDTLYVRIDTNCPWTVREAIAIPQTPGVGGDPDPKLLAKLRVA